MDYYNGYLIDDFYIWQLSNLDKERLDEAIWLVDNKVSIRQTARDFNCSKSKIWKDLRIVKKLSYELYQCVVKQLKLNKEKFF